MRAPAGDTWQRGTVGGERAPRRPGQGRQQAAAQPALGAGAQHVQPVADLGFHPQGGVVAGLLDPTGQRAGAAPDVQHPPGVRQQAGVGHSRDEPGRPGGRRAVRPGDGPLRRPFARPFARPAARHSPVIRPAALRRPCAGPVSIPCRRRPGPLARLSAQGARRGNSR